MKANRYVEWLNELSSGDVDKVGGKNASLGEMMQSLQKEGIRVPQGFATTAEAYRRFIEANNLSEELDVLLKSFRAGERGLDEVGKAIRKLFLNGEFPEAITAAIGEAYRELSGRYDSPHVDVAVRSSATAEDLPEASFAGQQESFLNVTGEKELLQSCCKCFASLFTDRAIFYREEKGFDHLQVALSIGIQKMVRSDKSGSGVMFSIDTETGFPDVVVINAAWGLGENIVQGTVNPDEYRVFKPLLKNKQLCPVIEKTLGNKERKMIYAKGGTHPVKNIDTRKRERRAFVLKDEEILLLARWACSIEKHYGCPMDIEWAKDGDTGDIFIVQARPETVQSQKSSDSLKTYRLKKKGKRLVQGLAIGDAITTGKALVLHTPSEIDQFEDGAVLVTEMTDPDWVPVMKRAAAIVTEHGGRTSHAAIVSRELGIPALVGAADATEILKDDQNVTVSCAEGDHGFVYEGILDYETEEIDLRNMPEIETRIMLNIASPDMAFRWWRLPVNGIGLARMEFIINNIIKIHPMALLHFDEIEDKAARDEIEYLTRGYDDKVEYFVDRLARGIAKISASQYPDPVIVRMSDFKTNEYANLIGGSPFEPKEENPMIGWRGASRYYSKRYRPGFDLECRAVKRVREQMGLSNVVIMIPFCRTLEEADKVLAVMEEDGLKRGVKGLEVYVMCEIPSNVVLAKEFAERFDGFSIGSNDLTQLTLGVDRDSAELSDIFDERNDAVKRLITQVIQSAHEAGRKVGICGQAPSDYPDFAEFLVDAGIDSISLTPDSVIPVRRRLGERLAVSPL